MSTFIDTTVLVTATSFGLFDPMLKKELEIHVGKVVYNPYDRPLTADELIEIIPTIDGYIAGLDSITSPVFEAAKKLKVISRYGVGYDAIDLDAAKSHNVIITNTPGANTSSVADLTIGLILGLLRSIPDANLNTKAGGWPRIRGKSLAGKTVGLIGLGAVGQAVVQRLQGFSCSVIAYDPLPNQAFANQYKVVLSGFEEVIRSADIVSLHLPLNPDTRNILNRKKIFEMKSGAYLVNTARGGLIDEEALCEALSKEHLAGAALDVYVNQPPGTDHPLFKIPQVIATPHMSSHTDDACNKMGWMAMRDCLSVLRGEEPLYRVM